MTTLLNDHYRMDALQPDNLAHVREFKRIAAAASEREPKKLLLTPSELISQSDEDVADMLRSSVALGIRRILDPGSEALLAVGALKLNPFEKRRHYGEIGSMYVEPECRSQGFASTIIRALIDEARERRLAVLELYVTKPNISAIRLYERFGFEKAGDIPKAFLVGDEYVDGQHMIRMLANEV